MSRPFPETIEDPTAISLPIAETNLKRVLTLRNQRPSLPTHEAASNSYSKLVPFAPAGTNATRLLGAHLSIRVSLETPGLGETHDRNGDCEVCPVPGRPSACMTRPSTPVDLLLPVTPSEAMLPSTNLTTSAPQQTTFEARSGGLQAPCVRFAASVAPAPCNTRFRLVASLAGVRIRTCWVAKKVSVIAVRLLGSLVHPALPRAMSDCRVAERKREYAGSPVRHLQMAEAAKKPPKAATASLLESTRLYSTLPPDLKTTRAIAPHRCDAGRSTFSTSAWTCPMFPVSRLDVAENELVTLQAVIYSVVSLADGSSCSVDLPPHWLRAE